MGLNLNNHLRELRQVISRRLNQLLENIDEKTSELERLFNKNIFLLIFHSRCSIERDIVDDVLLFLLNNEKYLEKDLILALDTFGGDADAAYHIGQVLQNKLGDKELSVLILRYAKSAGTLLACAGDKILMHSASELGPIDPQIYLEETKRWVSAKTIRDSLRQALETLKELNINNEK